MDGRLEHDGDRWRLIFTRNLHHPREKVWRALTEPEHLEAWFPTDIEGDRRAGAPLRFSHRDGLAPVMVGEMLVFDPPSLMVLRWGEDTLRFELRAEDDGCVLTLVDTFDEVGKAARDGAGWHTCLDALDHHLAGTLLPWTTYQRWQQVHPSYVERLGAEAATIGPPESFTDAQA